MTYRNKLLIFAAKTSFIFMLGFMTSHHFTKPVVRVKERIVMAEYRIPVTIEKPVYIDLPHKNTPYLDRQINIISAAIPAKALRP